MTTLMIDLDDGETDFYVMDGKPIALWPDWDYAEDWSEHPIREIHPFIPVIYGKEITEAQFRVLVKARHALSSPAQSALASASFENRIRLESHSESWCCEGSECCSIRTWLNCMGYKPSGLITK